MRRSISLLSIIAIILTTTLFFNACRKLDTRAALSPIEIENRFFTVEAGSPQIITKVIAELKKQNAISGFIPAFAQKEGYAIWDKSIVEERNNTFNFSGGGELSESLVFTPLVQQDSFKVNGFLMSRIEGDSVRLHLYRANDYDLYPYGDVDADTLTAERITLRLMELNDLVFGHSKYEITDSLLFTSSLTRSKKFKRTTLEAKPDTTLNGRFTFFLACFETVNCYCQRNGNYCSSEHRCNTGACDQCFMCIEVECMSIAIGGGPSTTWPPDPAPFPAPDPGEGGGGGGGGTPPSIPGGNCSGTNECGVYRSLIVEGRVPCGGCGPGPIVVVPIDPTFNPNEANNIIIDTSISNNYPCLTSLLNQIPNVNMETQKILSNTFGVNKMVNLVFAIDPALPLSTVAYTASPLWNDPHVLNYYDTVFLNPHVLARASKEYTVGTIYHEAFHAYIHFQFNLYRNNLIDSNVIKNNFPIFWNMALGNYASTSTIYLSHHEQMANSYVASIQNLVKTYYNNAAPDSIKNRVSRSIAWGGLEESTVWSLPGKDTCRIIADIEAAINTTTTPIINWGSCPNYSYNYDSLKLTLPCL